MENIRELAVEALLEIMEKDQYSHLVMKALLDKYNYLEGRDKAFLKRLVDGTVENAIKIDGIIDQFSKTPVRKMKPLIRNILRMSVYQLLFMDSVPDSAVCNEAVKLAGKRGFRNLQGFVNGVLRNIARRQEEIVFPDRKTDETAYLSVQYSMPRLIVEKFLAEHGAEKTEKILQAFQKPSPITIRVRESLSEMERQELIQKMKESGAEVIPHPALPYAYRLERVEGVQSLPGFLEGLFAVQDVSSMMVCEKAGIQAGDYLIDVCAAPGGKACHAAEKLQGTGKVSARDLTEYKAGLIRQNKDRLKLENLEVLVWDATVSRKQDIARADVVLADLPCSGLGIMGKKADIRYHVTREGMEELAKLQRTILQTVSEYVKPGGVLMYSTCTINRQENEENVDFVLKTLPFTLEEQKQFLPGIDETDGFFIAKLRKKKEL